jgi:hypothetical protein
VSKILVYKLKPGRLLINRPRDYTVRHFGDVNNSNNLVYQTVIVNCHVIVN